MEIARNARLILAFLACLGVAWPASDPPLLTVEEAIEKISNFVGPVRGNSKATFPTAISSAEVLLNSMAPVPMSKQCFESWRATLEQLVESGYLSDFQRTEAGIGIRTAQLTAKGRQFFGPALPGRFYSSVEIMEPSNAAGIKVTHLLRGPGKRKTSVRFRWRASEPFALMWKNQLFTKQCQGDIGLTGLSGEGSVAGHSHFVFKNQEWKLEKVIVGEHRDKE